MTRLERWVLPFALAAVLLVAGFVLYDISQPYEDPWCKTHREHVMCGALDRNSQWQRWKADGPDGPLHRLDRELQR